MEETFFKEFVEHLSLGKFVNASRVTGGLTHQMYSVITDKHHYAVKVLNPNIMKRKDALTNFHRAAMLEDRLKENEVAALYYIVANHQKLQKWKGYYCCLFDWFDGKVWEGDASSYQCEQIALLLSSIHNIDRKQVKIEKNYTKIPWKLYLSSLKQQDLDLYKTLKDSITILEELEERALACKDKIPNIVTICHNDLDKKNVLWKENEYRLIDLECLDYSSPYIELLETFLCWCGYEDCRVDYTKFRNMLDIYFKHSKIDWNIDWNVIFDSNIARLE